MMPDPDLDLRGQIARIDRDIAEGAKLHEESRKFAAETRRLAREDRYFPWLQLTSSGAIAAIVAAIVAHWR
jgi:hypothetical protein